MAYMLATYWFVQANVETNSPNYNLSVNNVHISYGFSFGLIVNTGSWSDVLSSSDCSVNLADSNLTIFINNSVLTRNIFPLILLGIFFPLILKFF